MCYPNTSYTRNWAPSKASPHDLHPKRCRNPPRDPTLHPKSPGAPLVWIGRTWFQTAWWSPHAARQWAFPSASVWHLCLAEPPLPPGTTRILWPLPLFWFLSPSGSSRVAMCYSSSAMLLVFGTLEQVLMNLKHATHITRAILIAQSKSYEWTTFT